MPLEEAPALRSAQREGGTGPRVVPYTFAFTGDFEPGELGLVWSLSSLALVLLLLPPCANIAILNYARTVTRQQEFAARHALGGSRARIVRQLFIEALVLTAAAAGVALLILRVVSVVVAGRLQNIPGGPPFWMAFDICTAPFSSLPSWPWPGLPCPVSCRHSRPRAGWRGWAPARLRGGRACGSAPRGPRC